MTNPSNNLHPQAGATIIEVLIAILLLSIGILSLSAMLSFTVQMPKLSGYRAQAVNLASSYVERMRANTDGFGNGAYDQSSTYDSLRTPQTTASSDHCDYPNCDMNAMAAMDFSDVKVAVRAELPAGGVFMLRDSQSGVPSRTDGNLWIVWQEPTTTSRLNPASTDNCPSQVTDNFSDPQPRCLYVRFKV